MRPKFTPEQIENLAYNVREFRSQLDFVPEERRLTQVNAFLDQIQRTLDGCNGPNYYLLKRPSIIVDHWPVPPELITTRKPFKFGQPDHPLKHNPFNPQVGIGGVGKIIDVPFNIRFDGVISPSESNSPFIEHGEKVINICCEGYYTGNHVNNCGK